MGQTSWAEEGIVGAGGGGCGRNLHYLAKKRHSAVAPAVPSPCPALRSGNDLLVVLACRSHRRLGHRGLRWCVWLLRYRTSVRCLVA